MISVAQELPLYMALAKEPSSLLFCAVPFISLLLKELKTG